MLSIRLIAITGALLAATASFELASIPAAQAQTTGSIQRGPSGLPLPRFASLKAEQVNMRVGPGKEYAVTWRYVRAGLPLEIIQEYDNWRRVRDADGTVGWVHGSLLSGKRTIVTAPWQTENSQSNASLVLHAAPRAKSDVVAYLQPGVVGTIKTCDGVWCELSLDHDGRSFSGFANQAELWGAYPDETIE